MVKFPLARTNITGLTAVTFLTMMLELAQILMSGSSYEPPGSGPEFRHEPLEEELRPEDPELLGGEVLREQEGRGEREEEQELSNSHHLLSLTGPPLAY